MAKLENLYGQLGRRTEQMNISKGIISDQQLDIQEKIKYILRYYKDRHGLRLFLLKQLLKHNLATSVKAKVLYSIASACHMLEGSYSPLRRNLMEISTLRKFLALNPIEAGEYWIRALKSLVEFDSEASENLVANLVVSDIPKFIDAKIKARMGIFLRTSQYKKAMELLKEHPLKLQNFKNIISHNKKYRSVLTVNSLAYLELLKNTDNSNYEREKRRINLADMIRSSINLVSTQHPIKSFFVPAKMRIIAWGMLKSREPVNGQ